MDSAGSAGLSLHEQNPQPQSHVHMGKLAQKIDHRKQLDIHHSFLGRGYSLYMAAIEDLTIRGSYRTSSCLLLRMNVSLIPSLPEHRESDLQFCLQQKQPILNNRSGLLILLRSTTKLHRYLHFKIINCQETASVAHVAIELTFVKGKGFLYSLAVPSIIYSIECPPQIKSDLPMDQQ